ncbi:hypothetical protein NX794_32295 [Streptomyces sp. LP11]|uniref:Uncharacterized protein n=1 Tax=Streptomyces pyxinicus TaxID=2970331 RepID=A0ABT2BBT8_9ACTN|nr:hypothetical protein [Streptomyces sp. LP11]MCS0605851.1 hypothetical protein [Streptomyces sp. LP11]
MRDPRSVRTVVNRVALGVLGAAHPAVGAGLTVGGTALGRRLPSWWPSRPSRPSQAGGPPPDQWGPAESAAPHATHTRPPIGAVPHRMPHVR